MIVNDPVLNKMPVGEMPRKDREEKSRWKISKDMWEFTCGTGNW